MGKSRLRVKLVGENGNVFNLMAICSRALKDAGMKEESKEMCDKIIKCGSYHEALAIMMEYCDVKDEVTKTIIPPPDEIESNSHHLFDAIEEVLKQSRVSKRLQSNVISYCLSILSNGIHIGEMGVTYEERMEWINKYKGYGVCR